MSHSQIPHCIILVATISCHRPVKNLMQTSGRIMIQILSRIFPHTKLNCLHLAKFGHKFLPVLHNSSIHQKPKTQVSWRKLSLKLGLDSFRLNCVTNQIPWISFGASFKITVRFIQKVCSQDLEVRFCHINCVHYYCILWVWFGIYPL